MNSLNDDGADEAAAGARGASGDGTRKWTRRGTRLNGWARQDKAARAARRSEA